MASEKEPSNVIEAASLFGEKVAERLKFTSGGGTSGGMDGWQASVESRLTSINTDIRELRSTTSGLSTNLATLTERVAHLPSKGFIVTATISSLAVIAAIVTFQSQIQAFLKISH